MVIEKAINEEFCSFIGCLPYQRTPQRKELRNGYIFKNLVTRFGLIEDITIPRSRGGFFPSILRRWKRREGRIAGTVNFLGTVRDWASIYSQLAILFEDRIQ